VEIKIIYFFIVDPKITQSCCPYLTCRHSLTKDSNYYLCL